MIQDRNRPRPFPVALHWVLSAAAITVLIAAVVNGDHALATIFAFSAIGSVSGAALGTFEPMGAPRRALVVLVWMSVIGFLISLVQF